MVSNIGMREWKLFTKRSLKMSLPSALTTLRGKFKNKIFSVFLTKNESKSIEKLKLNTNSFIKIPKEDRQPNSEREKAVSVKELPKPARSSNIINESRKTVRRNVKEVSINSTTIKNTMTVDNTSMKASFIKNLKNQLKNLETINNSIDKTNKQKTAKKPEKKLKYFSEIFNDKLKSKNSLSIKTNPVAYATSKPSKVDSSTISMTSSTINSRGHNKYKTKANTNTNITSITTNPLSSSHSNPASNPARFVKSQIFIENFKNLQNSNNPHNFLQMEKRPQKSSHAVSQISLNTHYNNTNANSTSFEKFSIDQGNNLNSTKSNSFVSSFSNNNTFSNSLKHLNLKSHFSSNNTVESTLSNNSFIQTKDLKTKFSSINLEKGKAASTCNVVISLHTNKMRNKKFVSSFIGNESLVKKSSVVEGKNLCINKFGIKK